MAVRTRRPVPRERDDVTIIEPTLRPQTADGYQSDPGSSWSARSFVTKRVSSQRTRAAAKQARRRAIRRRTDRGAGRPNSRI